MSSTKTIVETMKELLTDPKNRIKLDDFVSDQIKIFLEKSSLVNFPTEGLLPDKDKFMERIQKYNEIVKPLEEISILLAKWGDRDQQLILEKILKHLADSDKGSNGYKVWLSLGWYPLHRIIYGASISAISVKNFDVLDLLFTTKISFRETIQPIVVTVSVNMSDIADMWKTISGLEKKHVPRSEYLFESLRPTIEEILFLGNEYERLFDEVEIFTALSYSYLTGHNWGPIGRFGWKHGRGAYRNSPYEKILESAKNNTLDFPIKTVIFSGSNDKFIEIAESFKITLDKIGWW